MKAAIELLKDEINMVTEYIDLLRDYETDESLQIEKEETDRADYKQAIRVLESWPKWEKLIKAAGKVDKAKALASPYVGVDDLHVDVYDCQWEEKIRPLFQIRALLEALPEEEK